MNRVLFVDDEKSILTAIKRSFRKEAMEMHFASTAKEALEKMGAMEMTVIVADLGMPDMDGIALLKEVAKRWPKTVQIALTGQNELEEVFEVFQVIDLYKYVTKPWVAEDLAKYINEAFELYNSDANK